MSKIIIATHNGRFHADEAMAIAILKAFFQFGDVFLTNYNFVRTRDPELLAKADYVIDVGGIYDVGKNRFDHHMKDCRVPRLNGVPYSSAGLVWDEFGPEICDNNRVVALIDQRLIQPIDLNDTGTGTAKPFIFDGAIEDITLSQIVEDMNLNWQELNEVGDHRFELAVNLCSSVLDRFIKNIYAEILGELALDLAIRDAGEDKKEFIVLSGPLNWNYKDSPIFDSEIKFIVHRELDGDYCAVAVPPSFDKPFEQRKAFPAVWNWKRNDELAELTGVPDAVFSHGGGFIVFAHSEEGAIKLAQLALEI